MKFTMDWSIGEHSCNSNDKINSGFNLDSPALSPYPDVSWETFFDQDHHDRAAIRRSTAASLSSMSSECCSPLTPNDEPTDGSWPPTHTSEQVLFPGLEDLLLTPSALDNDGGYYIRDDQQTSLLASGKLLYASPEPIAFSSASHSLSHQAPVTYCGSSHVGGTIDTKHSAHERTGLAQSAHQLPSSISSGKPRVVHATPATASRKLGSYATEQQTQLEELMQDVPEDPDVRYTTHPLYITPPDSAGYHYCPFQSTTGCSHKPTNVKSTFDKILDSHIKPFKCKVIGCDIVSFSSTACLLRHEREAHGYHGHGCKPFTCLYPPCERAKPGCGFPRMYNLVDHMKRVHNHVVERKTPGTSAALKTNKANKVKKPRKASTDNALAKRRASIAVSATSAASGSRNNSLAMAHSRRDSAVGMDVVCQSIEPNEILDAASKVETTGITYNAWENDLDAIAQKLVTTLPMYDGAEFEQHGSIDNELYRNF